MVRWPVASVDAVDRDQRQRLGEVVRTDVQGGGEQASRSERRVVRGVAEQRNRKPDQRNTGVFDGGVAEELAQIVAGERVGDPGKCGDSADDQQRVPAPGRQRSKNIELETPQPVEAGAQCDRKCRCTEPRSGAVASW